MKNTIIAITVIMASYNLVNCSTKDSNPVEPEPTQTDPVKTCKISCTSADECPTPEKGVAACTKQQCETLDCSTDSDCPEPGQKCNKNVCVECVTDKQCEAPNPFCINGRCKECKDNSACIDPLRPRCASVGNAANSCICDSSDQCNTPNFGECRNQGCVCNSNAACSDTVAKTCNNGLCVECTADEHCPDNGKCEGAGSSQAYCTCTKDEHCTKEPTLTLCEKDEGICVECLENIDCKTGVCFRNQCIECNTDNDCTAQGLGTTCVSGTCNCEVDTECNIDSYTAVCK